MWRVDPEATRELMAAVWATHILDWSRLDYNRHASIKRKVLPQWGHHYDQNIEVPFPAKGCNLSFANVTPPLLHSGVMLAILDDSDDALTWTHRLAYRLTQEDNHWRMAREIAIELDLGDIGDPQGHRSLNWDTHNGDWRIIYALLELYRATDDARVLRLACRVGDNLLSSQAETGLFPRSGRRYARTGDEAPLALLHLAAAIEGKQSLLPRLIYDSRFFHCEYHGQLDASQEKRADKRTYDHLVFYGE